MVLSWNIDQYLFVNRFIVIAGCYVRIERWTTLPVDPTWSCDPGGLKALYRIPGKVASAFQIQTSLQTTVILNLDIYDWCMNWTKWLWHILFIFGILWLNACLAILAELILTKPLARFALGSNECVRCMYLFKNASPFFCCPPVLPFPNHWKEQPRRVTGVGHRVSQKIHRECWGSKLYKTVWPFLLKEA